MSEPIRFLKTRDVKSPSRANAYDAGIDFYVPEFTPEFVKILMEKNPEISISYEKIILCSEERILIPSGIRCQMSNVGRALIASNKSGIATKHGLIFGAQVVDFEYQGEIYLSLINASNVAVAIFPGMKILQFLEMPVFNSQIDVIENKTPEEFYAEPTARGTGGFGSSDK